MNTKMFCFQCEQTAKCKGCTGNSGVCGKSHVDAGLQDSITGALISLANTLTTPDKDTSRLIIEGYSQQSLTSASTRQPNTHYSHASAQHHTTWPKSGTLRKIYAH